MSSNNGPIVSKEFLTANKRDIDIPARCPFCKRGLVVLDKSQLVCAECGHVISERRKTVPGSGTYEKRKRDYDDPNVQKLARRHGPLTVIGYQNGRATRESSGSLTQAGLRKLDNETQLHTQSDRNKKKAFDELDKLAHNLNLRVLLVRRTEHIYLKALERDLIRGHSILGLITASLYAAIRETGDQKAVEELLRISDVSEAEVLKGYHLLMRELDQRSYLIR